MLQLGFQFLILPSFLCFSLTLPDSQAYFEQSYCVGMIIGPSIGSLLFTLAGYPLPFFVAAAAFLLSGSFVLFALTVTVSDSGVGETVPIMSLVSNAGVMVNVMACFLTLANLGYVDVTLTYSLEQFDLSSNQVACVFLVGGVVYMISLQLSAFLIKRLASWTYTFVLIGLALAALMFLLSGPMYPFSFEPSIGLAVARQALFGLSTGPLLVATFGAGISEAADSGFAVTLAMTSSYSALVSTGYALGSVALSLSICLP